MPDVNEFHGYLDRFSVIGNCVVAEGWANAKDLALWYKDCRVDLSIVALERADLIGHFGEGARMWGFYFAAALPDRVVDRNAFRLRFNAGKTVDPTTSFFRAEDQDYIRMVDGFYASVKPGSSLLEIGSRARSGTSYRDNFPADIDYVGLDISEGPNVHVTGDAHHLARVLNRTFDHVFSIATFEHILMPWKVALEMNKVMRNGATALIVSHAAWPLHEEPWDFFRFSKESWSGIFNAHTGFRMIEARYAYEASIVPQYLHSVHHTDMSRGKTYMLSGCLIERTHDAKVEWNAEASEVYNLDYSHG